MLACVYIKDRNICFYNEDRRFTNIGGFAYTLGQPLLDFLTYEPERFDEAFSSLAEAYDHPYAHRMLKEPEYLDEVRQYMSAGQTHEIYIHFYFQMFNDFIFTFVESPRKAVEKLALKMPSAAKKLEWVFKSDFEWLNTSTGIVEAILPDRKKQLYQAARDAVAVIKESFTLAQRAVTAEVEWLLEIRDNVEQQGLEINSPLEYLYMLEIFHKKQGGSFLYLENPFKTFYGIVQEPDIALLYEINSIQDLIRFEFIKMIEHDIFIKKCSNCGSYFIPRGRSDVEYCSHLYGDTGKRCSEIGAMLRYERKVADNPILVAYSKAYKRFNSRTRAKKMTQTEFLNWSEQARKLRDDCLDGKLSFDEFVAWLDQGRVRKARGGGNGT